MPRQLDLRESTRSRVFATTNRLLIGTARGAAILGVLGAGCGVAAGLRAQRYHWSWLGTIGLGVGVAFCVTVLAFALVNAAQVPVVLRAQRNEARARLRAIKEAAESYSIEVGDWYRRPSSGADGAVGHHRSAYPKHRTRSSVLRGAGSRRGRVRE